MVNILKEFVYRRQVALKGSETEITRRLLGFLEWMRGVPEAAKLLEELQDHGGSKLLNEALMKRNERHPLDFDPPEPPDARTIEQIASVGLSLVEEVRQQGAQNIAMVAADFSLYGSTKSSESVVARYVVPFLDYIEQRLPRSDDRPQRGNERAPALISESLKRFRQQHRDAESTCFIMMRFGKTRVHSQIESAIKKCLTKHTLVGLLARDKEFHDDLYPNIQTYIHGCGFGIAVFERLETEEFNPNIALEVGYMFGLKKQVLLLKDKTLRALHTDLVGKLYREFDPQNSEETIPPQIDRWLSDKGIA